MVLCISGAHEEDRKKLVSRGEDDRIRAAAAHDLGCLRPGPTEPNETRKSEDGSCFFVCQKKVKFTVQTGARIISRSRSNRQLGKRDKGSFSRAKAPEFPNFPPPLPSPPSHSSFSSFRLKWALAKKIK